MEGVTRTERGVRKQVEAQAKSEFLDASVIKRRGEAVKWQVIEMLFLAPPRLITPITHASRPPRCSRIMAAYNDSAAMSGAVSVRRLVTSTGGNTAVTARNEACIMAQLNIIAYRSSRVWP